jgi:DNA-3-methyladenine glycosylase
MKKRLGKVFFNRPAPTVARELIGKYLVSSLQESPVAYRIIETEAYEGPNDRASHASKGLTPRTSIMFGEPGKWYVYFIYGMYEMLNIVTGEKGYPAAVLIRGVEGFNGPGKLTRALGITRQLNGKVSNKNSGLWIEDRGELPKKITTAPRIGVGYAGPYWAAKKYRFLIKD